ncbi:FimB/Mfa2 family fimbrial subunit [Pontibacterium sp. N1Y112]|uniref:Basal-body rod modification protein FlgD n=1 Tax=Pontibacterium sinense TaxID=2781979 RepID=A0A8J7FHM2_9GAMM|nr:flagellar hook capping FlgD N-terminal domain-containing protein [Pontibacterium sinense]MBE9397823.1 FimB/Mfa2 family fimbrial subunit [Pontibacterium sinense]
MSDLSGVNNASSVFDQINQANKANSTASASSTETQNDMFMELLIAQLKNQSPTSPTDTNQFMSQVTEMSMVESMTNMEAAIGDMSSSLLSSQSALQASSMVGQNVFVESDKAMVGSGQGSIDGVLELPASASDVRVQIFDQNDTLVGTVELGQQAAGDHEYSFDSSELPAGEYRLLAQAQVDGKTQTLDNFVSHPVESVTLGQNGVGMTVNTALGGTSMGDIKQIAA